jgi:hypothetical protein
MARPNNGEVAVLGKITILSSFGCGERQYVDRNGEEIRSEVQVYNLDFPWTWLHSFASPDV